MLYNKDGRKGVKTPWPEEEARPLGSALHKGEELQRIQETRNAALTPIESVSMCPQNENTRTRAQLLVVFRYGLSPSVVLFTSLSFSRQAGNLSCLAPWPNNHPRVTHNQKSLICMHICRVLNSLCDDEKIEKSFFCHQKYVLKWLVGGVDFFLQSTEIKSLDWSKLEEVWKSVTASPSSIRGPC